MASTGTIAGDSPDLLKPLLESFQAARTAMQKEMEKDPVPEVSCDQIASTTKWLNSVVQAMNEYNKGFSRLTLPTLSDDQLHQNQALARESSRQLTLLFADKSQNFTTTSQSQVMKFGMGTQSQGIRDNLSKFSRFLEHFSQAKWLGDLIAPEFKKQKDFAMKILTHLQTGARVSLPQGQPTTTCNHCGQTATKTSCFCDSCNHCVCGCGSHMDTVCMHGCVEQPLYANGTRTCSYCRNPRRRFNSGGFCGGCLRCWHGCFAPCPKGTSQATISPKTAYSLCEDLPSGSSSLETLEGLAKMSEALATAFRQDVAVRKAAEKELEKKMDLLKDFAESVNEVPQVLRRFLLIRAGSIDDIEQLKAWVNQEEADEVHKMLEEFRDEVNEEKVLRRLKKKGTASEGSWSHLSGAFQSRS